MKLLRLYTRLLLIIVTCTLMLLSLFCGPVRTGRVTLLHTNDMHGQYVPLTGGSGAMGGMAAMKVYVEQGQDDQTIFIDAGDFQTGTLISQLEYKGARGGGFVEMMNRIGVDVSIIGNHEFDQGQMNMKGLMEVSDFPILSANLIKDGSLFAEGDYKIFKRGSLRIGVAGLTTDDLVGLVASKQLKDIEIKPVIDTARDLIQEMDPVTDLIVLVTHQGFYEDSLLAESVEGADVIVGGHSHTTLTEPRTVNDILIVQADSRTRYLGKLNLTVRNDRVAAFHGELIKCYADSVQPDAAMEAFVDSFQTVIDEDYGKIVGELKTAWKRASRGESNIGNYITDAMRAYGQTDIALINSGGIRKNLNAGPIRKSDILEILPFKNQVVTFELSGRDLEVLIRQNARYASTEISGFSYTYQKFGDNVQILKKSVKGNPIQPDKVYTCTSIDYVVFDNAEKYLGIKPVNTERLPHMLPDMIMEAVIRDHVISSKIEGRMKEVWLNESKL